MSRPAVEPRNVGAGRSVIQLSQLLRAPVVTPSGEAAGRVDDIIVHLCGADAYPLVTGTVVGIGGRRVFIGSGSIRRFDSDRVALVHNVIDLRRFERSVQPETLLQMYVLKATIPRDWRRRESVPRLVRETTSAADAPTSIGGEAGDWS